MFHSHRRSPMTERLRRSRLDSLDRFIVGVVWATLAGSIVVVALERQQWSRPTNWAAVAIFSCLLMVGELQSIAWLRLKDAGEVTPGWAFGFALLLLGSPALAMAAMAVASSLPDRCIARACAEQHSTPRRPSSPSSVARWC